MLPSLNRVFSHLPCPPWRFWGCWGLGMKWCRPKPRARGWAWGGCIGAWWAAFPPPACRGGLFTAAGGKPRLALPQWDRTSWSALGSGLNNVVNALALSGGTLYAGGEFTMAGDKVSAFAAEAIVGGTLISIITSSSSFGFTNGNSSFGFDVSGSPGQTQVVLGSADLTIWVPLQTNVLSN